jgi:hypothetical protein
MKQSSLLGLYLRYEENEYGPTSIQIDFPSMPRPLRLWLPT